MTITRIDEAGTVTLKAEGWLDTVSASVLGEAIEAVEAADALVLDFEKVEYMSSFGLRQVIIAAKKAREIGARFSVINVDTAVMSIFGMTGLDQRMEVSGKEAEEEEETAEKAEETPAP